MLKRPLSFRRQLFWLFSIVGVVLAVAVSFAFTWQSSENIREVYKTQALQATETLASMSELALLLDSGENALEAVQATLGYPAIRYVQLVNTEDKTILSQGDWSQPLMQRPHEQLRRHGAQLLKEEQNTWHFAAPVFTHGYQESDEQELITDARGLGREYLGYVYVVQDLSEQQRAQYRAFLNNLIIGLFFSMMLVALLHFSLKQLLRPLDELSSAMLSTKQGDISKFDSLKGPKEIREIGEIYNTMIDALEQRDLQLREHNEQLETVVAQRTRELKLARDEALDASQQKSMFLATMSHELKTPLNAILGYSDTLKDALDQEGFFDLSDEFDRIISNAEFLLELINSILDVVKAESGRLKLELQVVEIHQLLEKVKTNIQPLIEKNHNQLSINIAGSQFSSVMDETKLQQVFVNLLSNAAKFTENGNINVQINISESLLVFTVSDTGIGISTEQQGHIFEPFIQVDNRLERYYEGSGLGLAIIKYFCDLMGGSITLKSKVGEGSHFSVEIPLPMQDAQDANTQGLSGPGANPGLLDRPKPATN